jgi:hypothetical protein
MVRVVSWFVSQYPQAGLAGDAPDIGRGSGLRQGGPAQGDADPVRVEGVVVMNHGLFHGWPSCSLITAVSLKLLKPSMDVGTFANRPEPFHKPLEDVDMEDKLLQRVLHGEKDLSGSGFFDTLVEQIKQLESAAPQDCDVVIQAFDLSVSELAFIEPQTIILRGTDQVGNDGLAIIHYSQFVARLGYCALEPERPKRSIGFRRDAE